MRKIAKTCTAVIMVLLVVITSMIQTLALTETVQNDGHEVSYSYSEKGNVTYAYTDRVYIGSVYGTSWHTSKMTLNGMMATCVRSWVDGPSPGLHTNVTKYYIGNSSMRAKTFYWYFLKNGTTLANDASKYNSKCKTYADNLDQALAEIKAACGFTPYGGRYGLTHTLLDRMQQGKNNSNNGNDWNTVVNKLYPLCSNFPNVPSSIRIYYTYLGGGSLQPIMSYEATPTGKIQITKRTAHPTLTQGNPNFDLTGAKFTVYSNAACTNAVTTITCNSLIDLDETVTIAATGQTVTKQAARGISGDLPIGTYYIKETTAPKGYNLNPDVFQVTVTAGATATRLVNMTTSATSGSVSDPTKFGTGKLVKVSTNPEITDGSEDFSLENAVYGIYYDAACTRQYKRFVTDASGQSVVTDMIPRTYYVKEITAPKGFEKDTTVHTITIQADKTSILNVSDAPTYTPPPPEGFISISKFSSLPEITDDNECYSLEGAVYGIYSNSACTQLVQQLTTDENGSAMSDALPVATYYVKEISASQGYRVDVEAYSCSVVDQEITALRVEEKPITHTLSLLLQKNVPAGLQVDVTRLQGAQYTFNYYPGYYMTEEDLDTATVLKSWVFSTDQNGECLYDEAHLVAGDELYFDEDGNPVLPLGTVAIKETKAPDGFKLDETLFIRQITESGVNSITQYNSPTSIETVIPILRITVNKVWDDDNNRDGKRTKKVRVWLYRDGEAIDAIFLQDSNNWTGEFTDLPEGVADGNLEDLYHVYDYTLSETGPAVYEQASSELVVDPDDPYHFTCEFTNTYEPEKVSVSGHKEWEDYDDIMGRRPSSITVKLLRDGVVFMTKSVTAANNWQYEFTNLYKYHDGGQEYVYTVDEGGLQGYKKTINGTTIINTMKTGSITINKTDINDVPMKGVKFRVYSRDIENDGVVSTLTNGVYHFKSFTYSGSGYRVYTTNAQGDIVIEDLPWGNYKIVEESTIDGYIKYGEPIYVSLDPSKPDVSATVEVENAKIVLMETGGTGNTMIYAVAFTVAGSAIMLLCFYYFKKSKKSNLK